MVSASPVSTTDRRQTERKPVNLPGTLLVDGVESSCTVHDISPQGAHLTCDSDVPIDHQARLKVTANGEFVGVVAWRREGRIGLRFVQFEEDCLVLPKRAAS